MQLLVEVLVGLAIVVGWTFLIREFPSVLGSAWIQKIENKYAKNFEAYRADLEAQYGTLSKSIQFLSSNNTAWRSRVTESVELAWKDVLGVQAEFRDVVQGNDFFLPSELRDFFEKGERPGIAVFFEKYQGDSKFHQRVKALTRFLKEDHRIFCGERLWLIASTIITLHGRLAYLANQSFENAEYVDWRTDSKIRASLEISEHKSIHKEVTERRTGGLRVAIAYLKADFLREGIHVLSGSRALSESLGNAQDTLLAEIQRLERAELEPARKR